MFQMKRSHVVVLIVLFAIVWNTARLVFLPEGLKAALHIEQMLLEQSSSIITTTTTGNQLFPKHQITKIHRPFDNLTLIPPQLNQPLPYSSFSCVQPFEETILSNAKPFPNRYPDFVSRTCQFKNLYFHRHLRTFHYFVSPAEEQLMTRLEKNATVSIQDILQNKMTVSWSFIATKHVRKLAVKRFRFGDWDYFKWHPKLHFERRSNTSINTDSSNPKNSRCWRDLSWSHRQPPSSNNKQKHVFLLYHPSYSFNFGHFLLDDVATWFQMLLNFGHIHLDATTTTTARNNHNNDATTSIPLPVMVQHQSGDALFRCSPSHKQWHTCVGMYQRLLPSLLRVQWGENIDILRTENLFQDLAQHQQLSELVKTTCPRRWNMIRLDQVIVGSGRLAHYSCDGSCSIGRVTWMPLFRQWMLQQLFIERGESSSSPQRPSLDRVADPAHDYITFSLPFNSTRGSGLSNFSDIIQAAQALYGPRRVQVVNLANMTLSEQAWLVLHSCIFVTYEGGGSHTSIFLPPGGTVVLYNSNSIYTRRKFQAFHRDRTWYDTMSQVQKVWVSAEDRNNVALAMSIFAYYIPP